MLKLMQEFLEYPLVMKYMPRKGSLIGMVDVLSQAPYGDPSSLCLDPLDLQYHSFNRDTGQMAYKICYAAQALGVDNPCPFEQSLQPLYDAASEDKEYLKIV